MNARTSTVTLRTLIVDDDRKALDRMVSEIRGETLQQGRRRVEIHVEKLLVEVEGDDSGGFHFTEPTLERLAAVADEKWDLILLDYSFAAQEVQPQQWGENERAPRLGTNDHLLTIVDLKEAALGEGLAKRDRKRIEHFFEARRDVVLRSFQHDRPVDKLGSYETRLNSTQGAFPNSLLHRLDSFAMIYGSDADLRSDFYLGNPRGREFYRNIVVQLTLLHVRAALARRLAESNRKIAIPRSAGILAFLTAFVWAISSILTAITPDFVSSVQAGHWISAGKILFAMGVATIVSVWLLTLAVDRGVRSLFDWTS